MGGGSIRCGYPALGRPPPCDPLTGIFPVGIAAAVATVPRRRSSPMNARLTFAAPAVLALAALAACNPGPVVPSLVLYGPHRGAVRPLPERWRHGVDEPVAPRRRRARGLPGDDARPRPLRRRHGRRPRHAGGRLRRLPRGHRSRSAAPARSALTCLRNDPQLRHRGRQTGVAWGHGRPSRCGLVRHPRARPGRGRGGGRARQARASHARGPAGDRGLLPPLHRRRRARDDGHDPRPDRQRTAP